MRHIILATGLLFCAAWIAGCSAKEEVVKPEPLPKISKTVKLEKVWARRVGEGLDKQFLEFIPAVNDTAVCAASVNGVVACYQRDNGRKVWRRNLKESLTSGVAMGYGQVFVGTQDGQLLALSQENGETLWGASLSSEALAPPAVGGGQVFVQTADGKIHALNREDGMVNWVFETTIPALTMRGTATPLFLGELVVSGFSNGKVIGIDASNGALVWERRIATAEGTSELERLIDVDGQLDEWGGLVFASAYRGSVAAIETERGRSAWEHAYPGRVGVKRVLAAIVAVSDSGLVTAFDMREGQTLWENEKLKARKVTAPSVLDNRVLVGDFEGYLHVMEPSTGHLIGRKRVDRKGVTNVAVERDGVLYIQGDGGRLSAWRLVEKD